ncbi:MAG: hypothetical protein M4579_000399 [Chaenotheca gracillima]|nr:MAG: hypothetical protein M4579_000399 [Chaenotheca gracillima]
MAEMNDTSAPDSVTSGAGTSGGAPATDSTPSKNTTSKDKHCPYCNQAFTSSSLGRHLDLYIKEKNPKPADGIHDVDEIRKMRGSITRRQTRTSSARRESLTPTTSKRSSQDGRMSPAISQAPPLPPPSSTGSLRARPHRTTGWEATGVILDIPQSSDGLPRLEPRRDSSRQLQMKTRVEQSQKERETLDNARASELALRELLGIVKAARGLSANRRPSPSPFDFDPFTMTFPALVLRCLPLPPTLFSVQPFPTPTSCSLESPNQAQFEALVQSVRARFQRFRASPAAPRRKDSSTPFTHDMNGFPQENGNNRNQGMGQRPQFHEEEQKVMRHIHDAFSHWKTLPDKHRQDTWRLEILRAYSSEQDQRKEVERELDRTRQESENLRAQVEQLSACQHPREFLVHPVQTVPLPKETAAELQNHLLGDPRDWEYDTLVSKWKGVIQTNRRTTSGMSAQKALTPSATPDASSAAHTFQTPLNTKRLGPNPNNPANINNNNTGSNSNMQTSYNANTNTDMTNGFDAEADDDDEELEDAPAEQADDDPSATVAGHARAPQAIMDRGVLDPSLHSNGGHVNMGGMDGVDVGHGYERQIFRV